MRKEYDFGQADRGRFGNDEAILIPPVHLDADILEFLTPRADARGLSVSDLVNALLKEHIELIKTAG